MAHKGRVVQQDARTTGSPEVVDAQSPSVVSRRKGGAVVLAVTGSFPGVAAAANAALVRALCHDPRSVTCDLSAVTGELDERSLETLLETGGHLEHWPGTGLLLVHHDDRLPDRLRAMYAGARTVRATAAGALLEPTRAPGPPGVRVHLDPHPLAGRKARDFVSRTCLDWRRPDAIGSVVLVVSELVTNGLTHAGTGVDVTFRSVGDRLRLAVHDGSDQPPRLLPSPPRPDRGHGLHLVAGFCRAWGSLPAPEGGKAVWAVLDI